MVQVQGRIRQPEEFGDIIVARRGGQPVKLSQVADIVDGQQEQESLALYNGQRTLALDVLKAQGENTIEVVDGLQAALKELAAAAARRIPASRSKSITRRLAPDPGRRSTTSQAR